MEYKVIRNEKLKDFEKEVQKALDNGFTLNGNLVIATVILPEIEATTIFHQVLIKEIKEKKAVPRARSK